MIKNAIIILTVIVSILAIVLALSYAITESEKIECYKLQKQAKEFKNYGFYITKNQDIQCNKIHKIIINTKILK